MNDGVSVSIHRVTEMCLGVLAIFWGVILVLPGDSFAGIERYELFGKYAPDTAWGVVMLICGTVTTIRMPRWAHKHAHWVLFAVWLGMTVLSLLSTITHPALLIASLTFAIAFIHISKYFRLAYSLMIRPSGQQSPLVVGDER